MLGSERGINEWKIIQLSRLGLSTAGLFCVEKLHLHGRAQSIYQQKQSISQHKGIPLNNRGTINEPSQLTNQYRKVSTVSGIFTASNNGGWKPINFSNHGEQKYSNYCVEAMKVRLAV